jgi:hypothetical protein
MPAAPEDAEEVTVEKYLKESIVGIRTLYTPYTSSY